MFHGAHIATHAAAERQRRIQREEEEDMTRYTRDELENDWEFKIVRSGSGAFRKPDVLETLIEEEALAGWEMVEKFDNSRVRFKRPKNARKRDSMLPDYVDPYRTQYGGLMPRNILFISMGLLIAGVLAFGLMVAQQGGSTGNDGVVFTPVIFLIAGLVVIGGIFAVIRSANR